MERSIVEVARAAGTTSRTLRHYDSIGLVRPSRVGHNGYRYYDDRALVRLQRVLLLRELGLGLDAIGEVLAAQDARTADERPELAEARILRSHLELLEKESRRIAAQIGAVERTIAALEAAGADADGPAAGPADPDPVTGPRPAAGAGSDINAEERGDLMSQNMFDGFDHTQYREEVEQRWGEDAYAQGDRWWRSMSADERAEWQGRVARLSADWSAAAERGEDPEGAAAQELARRHVEWLRGIPGTPAWKGTRSVPAPEFVRPLPQPAWKGTRSVPAPESARPLPQPASSGSDIAGYVKGLAEMYVADERFAANYGGGEGARFVRDALHAYVERELRD